MSNGEVCCILGICCPPEQRQQKLTSFIVDSLGCDEKVADTLSTLIDVNFDLAPKGTLQPLVDAVSQMAVKHSHDKDTE